MSFFSEDWLKSAQDYSFVKFERSLFEIKKLCISVTCRDIIIYTKGRLQYANQFRR